MKTENLNPKAYKMAQDLMACRSGLPLATAMAAVNYKLANLASQMHIKVDTMSGYAPTPVNVYSLVLLNSGGGKNSSLGLLDRLFFSDAFEKIRDKAYPYYKGEALAMLEERGIERDIHNWTQSISNATISGMFAYAESYSIVKFGSLNVEMDEIGNALISKAELFENLLTPYDNGDFQPVAKRTDANALDITGLPVNLYCFGNKVRLLNGDSTEQAFMQRIDEGYGRRFIFVDDNSEPKLQSPQEVVDEMRTAEKIKQMRTVERTEFADLIDADNFKKILTLSDEAMYEYAVIKSESAHYLADKKGVPPAVEADISERYFKTIKLAGVYAFFEGKNIVEKQHIQQAYEIIKYSSGVLAKLRKIKPTHERLLDALLLESDKVTSQHILGYSFINSSWTKKVLEIIDLAKQLASERGYEWIEDSVKGVTYYTVIKEDEQPKESLF